MYKCGHEGCEKAYGTLNHLNAHVTMQGHGQKRTPEGEFDVEFQKGLQACGFFFFGHAESQHSGRASLARSARC